jgi:hypothetical protein
MTFEQSPAWRGDGVVEVEERFVRSGHGISFGMAEGLDRGVE